jgi:hypothetical protein
MACAGAFARQAALLLERCDGPLDLDDAVHVIEAVVAVFCRGCPPPPRIQQHRIRSQAGRAGDAGSGATLSRSIPAQIEPPARHSASEEQQRITSLAWDKLDLYASMAVQQSSGGGQRRPPHPMRMGLSMQ